MTGMHPEQLRQTVARATLPLLGEYETLTTAQIALAAGVGEPDAPDVRLLDPALLRR